MAEVIMARNRNDKRSRLIVSAGDLFHRLGIYATTLADIAELACVPLGNVYYYFKSKEAIVKAVIEHRRRILQQQFEELNTIPNSKERLYALIRHSLTTIDQIISFGDALGSLCQELGKHGGDVASEAADLMKDIMGWCEKQFNAMGKGDRSENLAINLVSCLQGLSLLTLTMKDKKYIQTQTEYLVNWVENV
jgi:TetR/AcrR family transcriptional repressor of nem operon